MSALDRDRSFSIEIVQQTQAFLILLSGIVLWCTPKTVLPLGTALGTGRRISMAGRLTALKVRTAKPGKHGDGGNLYLLVSQTGSRKWVLRFRLRGQKSREM